MKYKIVVDKQSRTNPSADKKEYIIDIEELRFKGNIYDSLVITKDEDYVLRRLKLTEFYVLEELEEPIKEPLENINIELFEGDNYIYLIDMVGNKFYAEYIVKNDFTDMYTTKSEFKTGIEQTSRKIEIMASTKLDKNEFATYLEINSEAVKVAWNKIAEFIQMMIINQNASLAILDDNKKVLMSLDKTGQHFYDSETVFANMGVQKFDGNKFIAFAVPGDYNQSIKDGMAWGMITQSDQKFWPILFVKDFKMASKNAGDFSGQLVLTACDLVLAGDTNGIISGNVKIVGGLSGEINFINTEDESILLQIIPKNEYDSNSPKINLLNSIHFFENALGSHSFRIGEEQKYVLQTDEGDFHVAGGTILLGTNSSKATISMYPSSMVQIHGADLDVDGNVYANNISSDKKIKKNIKNSSACALDIIKKIKHKEFDKKDDGKHYNIGYIAQDMEKIDPNFVIKRPADPKRKIEERYYINELPIIATLSKAIQEQQEQINKLQSKIEKLEARRR